MAEEDTETELKRLRHENRAFVAAAASRHADRWLRPAALAMVSAFSAAGLVFAYYPTGSATAIVVAIVASGTALAAAVAFFRAGRTRDYRFLDLMTSELSSTLDNKALVAAGGTETVLNWSKPQTHLRFNARRMRWNASFALGIMLAAVVLALLFYAFADYLAHLANREPAWQATLAARLGVGALMVFAVQILANIYRYSIRMAAFYEGRAAALMLARDEGSGKIDDLRVLKEYVDWLAGDKVEFDSAPKAPTELLVEVAKAAAEGVKKAT